MTVKYVTFKLVEASTSEALPHRIRYSDSEEEDEDEVSLNMTPSTPDLTSDSSTCGTSTSTTSNNRSSCTKHSKRFNTIWLKGRRHWLIYEKGVGMFCLLCQKYDKRPYDRDVWNKTHVRGLDCRVFLTMKKVPPIKTA